MPSSESPRSPGLLHLESLQHREKILHRLVLHSIHLGHFVHIDSRNARMSVPFHFEPDQQLWVRTSKIGESLVVHEISHVPRAASMSTVVDHQLLELPHTVHRHDDNDVLIRVLYCCTH